MLDDLIKTPVELRDEEWEDQFFFSLLNTPIRVTRDTPENGPDGWPYLLVSSTKGTETLQELANWASTRGIGLVLNAHKGVPDYIFTYGMLWNFRERGNFISRESSQRESAALKWSSGQTLWLGNPSVQYLPAYVRDILRQFLTDQGVKNPRVAMLSVDQKQFDLCFSQESLGSPPPSEHAGITEALAWFVPMHYSVGLVSEKSVGQDFFSL